MSDGAPGPWRIDGEVVVDADNVEIAIVDVVNRPRPAWERSARLIASAPELLARVQARFSACTCGDGAPDGSDESFDQHACADCHADRAAISKATGGAP